MPLILSCLLCWDIYLLHFSYTVGLLSKVERGFQAYFALEIVAESFTETISNFKLLAVWQNIYKLEVRQLFGCITE